MPDINGLGDSAPYVWTGGAGLLGRNRGQLPRAPSHQPISRL